MIDVDKQIEHWRKGAAEEWELAAHLFSENRTRHGLFFLHLTLEKALKAHVCRTTRDIPPKAHNLVRLAELAVLTLSEDDKSFLSKMSRFNIEGRYPDTYDELPSATSIAQLQQECERMYQWLLKQL